MSRALPWYKRSPADWQRGTRKDAMSLELRGFYSECLDAMWDLQGQLPKDAKKLAMLTGTNARLVRALMPKLLELGKMLETETGYLNPRMMADILGIDELELEGEFAPIQHPIEIDSRSIGDRTNLEPISKIQKSSMITTRDLEIDRDIDSLGNTRADVLHLQAYQRGLELKGGAKAKSARAISRSRGELDGSRGIAFEDGKLTVVNGTAAKLLEDFPGVSLEAVCDRAGPELAKFNWPNHNDALAVLRKWARIALESKTSSSTPSSGKRMDFASERIERAKALMIKTTGGVQ